MTSLEPKIGRPLKFDDIEDLRIKIDLYFDDCDTEQDGRIWSHDEIVTDAGEQVCQNCWKEKKTRGCLLVGGIYKHRSPSVPVEPDRPTNRRR